MREITPDDVGKKVRLRNGEVSEITGFKEHNKEYPVALGNSLPRSVNGEIFLDDGYSSSDIVEIIGDDLKVEAESDMVNSPPHYTKHPSGVECIEVTRHMSFNLGNAVKYIWRCGDKGNAIQDLEKAIWYLKDEIKRIKEGDDNDK